MEKFIKIMDRHITPVPDHLKSKLERSFVLSNYNRLFPTSILLFIITLSIGDFQSNFIRISVLKKGFILFNLIFIPIIYAIWKRRETIPVKLAQYVMGIYYFVLMMVTAMVVLGVQELSFLHIYLMSVFGIAITVEMHPLYLFLLILPAHLFTIFMVPFTTDDSLVIHTLLVNISFSNLAAIILSFMAYNNRVSAFVNKELIIEKNEQLADLVERDGMTGLYNHKASFEKLKKEMDQSNRTDAPLSIILFDIDDFKQVNDTYGHLTGDSVLRKLSHLMKNITRTTDIVGRYGGEEFLLVLPGTDLNGAKILTKKIQSELRTTSFEKDITITVSGGASEYSDESVDELISITDKKLYKAKKSGKNRFIHSTEKRVQLSQGLT